MNGLKWLMGVLGTVTAGLLLAIILRFWQMPDDISEMKLTLSLQMEAIKGDVRVVEESVANVRKNLDSLDNRVTGVEASHSYRGAP